MDVLSLVARLTLDSSQYDRELDGAANKAHGFGSRIGSGIATAAKVGGAAITAAAAAVGTLVKNSVENYAEYEQLVGGVETLFKNSADVVQKYASNAFKTAGLSANEYMETVTSFSASLLQSLGGDTEAAAKYADMAITDMSDNANKMGSSMESIQNAYQGFAKQNYTMLDNLKLGYGGTKEEMQRLLDDAMALSGVKYDLSSYSDIVDAIHVIQTEMGITGTTALEASETISGSIASMKSAWKNLVVGIADENADFGLLVDNFVESVTTVGNNIVPRVGKVLSGIGRLVEGLAPVITRALPGLISNVLPPLLRSAASLVSSIGKALIENLPMLLSVGLDLILMLANGIADNLPKLIPTIVDVLLQIVDTLTNPNNLSALIDAAIAIILALADGLIQALPRLIEAAPTIITNLVTAIIQNAPKLMEAGFQLVVSLASGILQAIPNAVSASIQMTEDIKATVENGLAGLWDRVKPIFENFGNAIRETVNEDLDNIKQAHEENGGGLQGVAAATMEGLKSKWTFGFDVINNITGGKLDWIKQALSDTMSTLLTSATSGFNNIINALQNFWNNVTSTVTGLVNNAITWGRDLVQNFINGITQRFQSLRATLSNFGSMVRAFIGFSEPEEGPLSNFHTYAPDMMKLFAEGIRDNEHIVADQLARSFDFGTQLMPAYQGDGAGQEFSIPRVQENRDLTVVFMMDRAEVGRMVYTLNNEETQRVGVNLAGGFA